MDYTFKNNNVYITGNELFDLEKTFTCGQCFRFNKSEDGKWHGVVADKEIILWQNHDKIVMEDVSRDEFENFWYNYFDLDRNYQEINEAFSANKTLNTALNYGKGIRILNQEPWESLCSFIISQNNNIPRIKGIIDRLCSSFGKKLINSYSFPSADVIANLTLEDLAPLRSGFRAKYILDAAKKVSLGEINLEKISKLGSDKARQELTKIYGVGEKVADCTLLFGMGHIDVCPKDVWIKRALTVLFDGDFPQCAIGYAGIAQQYIFYYARETKLDI